MASRQPYALYPELTRGRLVHEDENPERSCFQRDRDRILHSVAFRRLEYKTQVFINHEGDHFRTRLTHSLEVAQIARSVARSLAVDEDLSEAIALAHDLGHPPFGHAGEDAMSEVMEAEGGFDHNDQTFRVVTMLEQRYARFDGLNLTWECLEGIVKHSGPLKGPLATKPLPATIDHYDKLYDMRLDEMGSVEAQIAAIADDTAYYNHDIDDGIRAGLFTLDDLKEIDMLGKIIAQKKKDYPTLDGSRLVHEVVRESFGLMIHDLLKTSRANLADAKVQSAEDVRKLKEPVIRYSEKVFTELKSLRKFLYARMYQHYRVNRIREKATRLLKELFQFYLENPDCLPDTWQKKIKESDQTLMRVVADYVAGMTDRYAIDQHRALFDIYTKAF